MLTTILVVTSFQVCCVAVQVQAYQKEQNDEKIVSITGTGAIVRRKAGHAQRLSRDVEASVMRNPDQDVQAQFLTNTSTLASSLAVDTGIFKHYAVAVELVILFVACGVFYMKRSDMSSWQNGLLGLTTFLQAGIFITYCSLSIGHMFLQQRAGITGYSFMAATLMIYFGKCVVSLGMFLSKGDCLAGFSTLLVPSGTRFGKMPGCVLPMIPGLMYAGYDALSFVSLHNLDPGTYQILVQTRIVLVGFLWQLMFQRKLSNTQWMALLCFLVAGITKGTDFASLVAVGFQGICFVMLQNCMSASANVATELLLKEMLMPTDLVNACTYFWGLVGLAMAMLWSHGSDALYTMLLSPAAWLKLKEDPYMISSICCLVVFGIVTAYLLKQLSNIAKEVGGGIVIVATQIVELIFFGGAATSLLGLLGVNMAVFGIFLYSTAPVQDKPKTSAAKDNRESAN